MFQFTTTNVINSNYEHGYTPEGDVNVDSKHSLWSLQEETNTFVVKRVGNFKKDYIQHIFKAEPVTPVKAKAVFDLADINGKDGDQFRLDVYITLTQGSNNALYANDAYYKGKPFTVDFVWKNSASDTAIALVDTIKKFILHIHGEKMVEVTVDGSQVTVTAVNEYQIFKKAVIEKLDTKAYHGMGEYTVVLEADLTQGKEGFGTYSWILHNLRIPTTARQGFLAWNEEENPIPGAKYTQFTIHYCVDRGTLGTNAVGDQVTSKTTHVFYVKDDIVGEFEAALANIAPEEGIVTVPED